MEDELFLSTPSARRATAVGLAHPQPRILISIHALREEGDLLAGLFRVGFPISIHALREEGDFSSRIQLWPA